MRRWLTPTLAVFVFAASLLCLATRPVALRAATATDQGIPKKFRSLTDIGLLERDKSLSTKQRTDILLKWYRQELKHPSSTCKGPCGSCITSGYIQVQFIKALSPLGDIPTLLKVKSDRNTPSEIRQGVSIALLLSGDKSQGETVAGILQANRDGNYRVIAATALSFTADKSYIEILKGSLNDPFYSYGRSDVGPTQELPRYPVREEAEASIRRLQRPDFLQAANERAQRFQDSLKEVYPSGHANVSK